MDIDYKELQKQRKEQILKSGKYCSAEIVIGENDNSPIMAIKVHKVGSEEKAKLMLAMRETIVMLAKKDPLAYYNISKFKSRSEFCRRRRYRQAYT